MVGRDEEIPEDDIEAMARAGCTSVQFGLESGSEEVRLRVYKKGYTDKVVYSIPKLLRKHKITYRTNNIMGSPAETLEDMRMVRADALSYANGRDVDNAVKSIARYDDLTRKLQVGYYLRTLETDEFKQARARALRGRLEQLKDVVEAGEFDRVRELGRRVSSAHRRLREAFE